MSIVLRLIEDSNERLVTITMSADFISSADGFFPLATIVSIIIGDDEK